jgi:hypothetical protein
MTTDYKDECDNLMLYENGEKTFTRKIYNVISKRLENYKCSEIASNLQDELFERLDKLKNTLPTILELPEQKWIKIEEFFFACGFFEVKETPLFLDITSDITAPRRYLHPKLYIDDWKQEDDLRRFVLEWMGVPFKNENGDTIWVKETYRPPDKIEIIKRKKVKIPQPNVVNTKAVNMLYCYGYYI